MTVQQAIAAAERILPGEPQVGDGPDPRWQAIIAVGEFSASDPAPVLAFARRWGVVDDADLRDAIATSVLEHVLEHHFEAVMPEVETAVRGDPRFADCFARCWAMGRAATPVNLARFEKLKRVAAGAV